MTALSFGKLALLAVSLLNVVAIQSFETESSPVSIISKGLATTCCYNAAAIAPYLIVETPGALQKIFIVDSLLSLLTSAYTLNQSDGLTNPKQISSKKKSTKDALTLLGKLSLCLLHTASAVGFTMCITNLHLEELQKTGDQLYHGFAVGHHLVSIPVLLRDAYILFNSITAALKQQEIKAEVKEIA